MQEFFQCRNGRAVLDEDMSAKLFAIMELRPDAKSDEDSGFERNEIGMAEMFGLVYNQEARYCPEYKSWYTYHGGAWRRDNDGILVSEKLKDFVRLMTIYCGEIEDEEQRKSYYKFVDSMGDRRMRDRILKDAKGRMVIAATEFDANPYLINCLNGTYDLRNCTFHEHRWDDFCTMQTAFRHTVSREVRSERWEQFIDEITMGHKDKADFLQRALGYSLLGMANEECMFILWGKTTRNGKSTLLNTIQQMLGDYAAVAPVGMICAGDRKKDAEAASPILAGLKGKRFVTMAESNEYGKLDEEKIKQYTGGEAISARALYQESFSYTPQFTLWLSCNDLPAVTDKSLFASERIRMVAFNRHFDNNEQDKHLKNELLTEDNMKGIFMWLVRGYKMYRQDGLEMSERMAAVVKQYEDDNDIVLQFLEARCEQAEGATIKRKDLYNAFKSWAKSEGARILPLSKFKNEMERKTEWYEAEVNYNGYPVYRGLKLKEVIE